MSAAERHIRFYHIHMVCMWSMDGDTSLVARVARSAGVVLVAGWPRGRAGSAVRAAAAAATRCAPHDLMRLDLERA
eukprot:7308708-Prymnesium_polylepis.2